MHLRARTDAIRVNARLDDEHAGSAAYLRAITGLALRGIVKEAIDHCRAGVSSASARASAVDNLL